MRIACCLLLLTGCDLLAEDTDIVGWTPDRGDTGIDTDLDEDTTVRAECPDDLVAATRASVSVQVSVLDTRQISLLPGNTPHDGMPPVCVSRDGLRAQILLTAEDQPYAWMRSERSEVGSVALAGATGFEIEVFGDDQPITFGDGDWFEGNWLVNETRDGFIHNVNGTARRDTRSLSVIIDAEVTP